MEGQLAQDPADQRISVLAAGQHGGVSHAQLLELGLGKTAIQKRARAGRLHRVHRGMYAVGHPLLTQHGRFMAAALACGEGAVISHGCAAALWGLPWRQTARIDVTVPGRGGRSTRRLVVVHRARLAPGEVTVKDGIPVILNLQATDQELSKRLIDFASGLTYALNGGMQRVADKVFLLTPRNVEVSAEERARILERGGFFNQA